MAGGTATITAWPPHAEKGKGSMTHQEVLVQWQGAAGQQGVEVLRQAGRKKRHVHVPHSQPQHPHGVIQARQGGGRRGA